MIHDLLFIIDKERLRNNVYDGLPLEVLPFFKLKSIPEVEKKSCYFYNRIDENGIRWISYHYKDLSEKQDEDPDLRKVLAELAEEK